MRISIYESGEKREQELLEREHLKRVEFSDVEYEYGSSAYLHFQWIRHKGVYGIAEWGYRSDHLFTGFAVMRNDVDYFRHAFVRRTDQECCVTSA
jgi:hypothetical protein